VTLADKYKKELDGLGFVAYYDVQDLKGVIEGTKIICQIDSLHKLYAEEHYDMLVLDEMTYTMDHFITFTKEKSECNKILESLIKKSPKIIVTDALLTNEYMDYIRRLGRTDILIHQYLRQPYTSRTYTIIKDKDRMMYLICQSLKQGKKVVIASNTEKWATALAKLLSENHPDLDIGLYTGNNKPGGHQDVSTLWDKHDVLIYTPVIFAGISYQGNKFEEIYGYFTRASCGPEGALQMLLRCRNIDIMKICITGKERNNLPCNNRVIRKLEEYKNYVVTHYDRTDSAQKIFKASFVKNGINTEKAYFYIYCCVIRRICEGSKNYEKFLCQYLHDMGIRYVPYDDNELLNDEHIVNVSEDIKYEKIKEIQHEMEIFNERMLKIRKDREEKAERGIAEAPNITDPYIDKSILPAMKKDDCKTMETIWTLQKAKICSEYEITDFDVEFGKESLELLRVHRNTRLFYEVTKLPHRSDEYNKRLHQIRESMKKKDNIVNFEGDKLSDAEKLYQGGLCEIALDLIDMVKANKETNPFCADINIKYDGDKIREYLGKCLTFIYEYFREDSKIYMFYMQKTCTDLTRLILKETFGFTVNFKKKILKSPFKLEIEKFYPRVGTYSTKKLDVEIFYMENLTIYQASLDTKTMLL
jgi:hypothetical protein